MSACSKFYESHSFQSSLGSIHECLDTSLGHHIPLHFGLCNGQNTTNLFQAARDFLVHGGQNIQNIMLPLKNLIDDALFQTRRLIGIVLGRFWLYSNGIKSLVKSEVTVSIFVTAS